MHPEIVARGTETVLYVREIGDYKVTPEIALQKLILHLRRTEIPGVIQGIYGMGLDNPQLTESNACRFDACAKVKLNDKIEFAECVQEKEIEGGRFAVFTHNGPYAELSMVCNEIFHKWFPTSEYTPDVRPLFCEYTNYLDDSNEAKTTKIYVPIKG
jgi:AraC family transcriptional regulator